MRHPPPEGFPSGQREQTVNLPCLHFGGSNPPPSTRFDERAGVAQLVELQPSKLDVEGSSPFARSSTWCKDRSNLKIRPRSTVAVHFLGKEGVASSILAEGSAT